MEYWVEIAASDHGHGGEGWQLGRCLWSPSTDKQGRDRYAIMRVPKTNDAVFHIIRSAGARYLTGCSRIKEPARLTHEKPSEPGAWGEFSEFFRIELTAYASLQDPISMSEFENIHFDDILSDITPKSPSHYPYMSYGDGIRVKQGLYLGRASGNILSLFLLYAGLASKEEVSPPPIQDSKLFREGQQFRAEATYFSRNRSLRQAAINKFGLDCCVCGFNFGKVYGELGEGFIEVHHLDGLADQARNGPLESSVDELRPLCANCHRMAHRSNPPLSIEVLKKLLVNSC